MNTKKALRKFKKLQKSTLKKLKKQQKQQLSSALKQLKKAQKKQRAKTLKQLKKIIKKQDGNTISQPKFKHTLKAVSALSTPTPLDNSTPQNNQRHKSTQQKITHIIDLKRKPTTHTKKDNLQKILRLPLKSHPCKGCPALSKGICKCAAKKFAS